MLATGKDVRFSKVCISGKTNTTAISKISRNITFLVQQRLLATSSNCQHCYHTVRTPASIKLKRQATGGSDKFSFNYDCKHHTQFNYGCKKRKQTCKKSGTDKKQTTCSPWTTSRVTGGRTPEPPPLWGVRRQLGCLVVAITQVGLRVGGVWQRVINAAAWRWLVQLVLTHLLTMQVLSTHTFYWFRSQQASGFQTLI